MTSRTSNVPVDGMTIAFERSSLGPWHHPYYPIFLVRMIVWQNFEMSASNQRQRVFLILSPTQHTHSPRSQNQGEHPRELVVKYTVAHHGKPVSAERYRVVPILRYGQTPSAVPEPVHGIKGGLTRAPPRQVLEAIAHTHDARSSIVKVKPHPDCLSEGGFESTVRLRLALMHPKHDVVLAWCDSTRFVIMTRSLPSAKRMHTCVRHEF
jgi:hypothetical protein